MSENNAPHLPDDVYPAMRMRWMFVLVLVVSVLAGIAGGTYAMRFFLPGILSELITTLPLSNQVKRAVDAEVESPFLDMVRVTNSLVDARGVVVGSALSYTSDGWMVSQEDVVKRARKVRVSSELHAIDRAGVVTDPASGLSFFKIDISDVASPRVVDNARFDAGDRVFVVGQSNGVFEGRVSIPFGSLPTARDVYDAEVYHRVIVLDRIFPDALIGAPVFDIRGNVVGVLGVDAGYEQQNIVVPAHHFSASFKDVATEGSVLHPYVGARFGLSDATGVDLSVFKAGVELKGSSRLGIAAVRFGSPAWDAGLRDGDVVMRIDDHVVGIVKSFPELILQYNPGQVVKVVYVRNGEELETELTMGTK